MHIVSNTWHSWNLTPYSAERCFHTLQWVWHRLVRATCWNHGRIDRIILMILTGAASPFPTTPRPNREGLLHHSDTKSARRHRNHESSPWVMFRNKHSASVQISHVTHMYWLGLTQMLWSFDRRHGNSHPNKHPYALFIYCFFYLEGDVASAAPKKNWQQTDEEWDIELLFGENLRAKNTRMWCRRTGQYLIAQIQSVERGAEDVSPPSSSLIRLIIIKRLSEQWQKVWEKYDFL